MSEISMTSHVANEKQCPRADCRGWQGHVTYVNGDQRTTLRVREKCAALAAWVDRKERQVCPLHDE